MPKGVEWNINRMKKEGVLKRLGADKGGRSLRSDWRWLLPRLKAGLRRWLLLTSLAEDAIAKPAAGFFAGQTAQRSAGDSTSRGDGWRCQDTDAGRGRRGPR
jgi:hypothetical protein